MADSELAWCSAALSGARALWVAGAGACLLAGDLPGVGVEALRRISHYGKLRSEVAECTDAGAFLHLQARIAELSLPPRAVWTSYYVGGAALNAVCLAWEPCLLLGLLQFHLLRRVYETRRVTRFSETRREHPLTVCVGAFFYVLLGPSIALEVRVARLRSFDQPAHQMPAEGWSSGLAAFALAGFLAANAAQHLAHIELAQLRPRKQAPRSRASSSAQYGVPAGWLFTHISCCPHYSSEVLLYAALAVLAATDAAGVVGGAGMTIAHGMFEMRVCVCAWGAALFSFVNLSITAVRTRRWYLKRPEASHLSKWAIVPFVL